jgi:hypothetical protein
VTNTFATILRCMKRVTHNTELYVKRGDKMDIFILFCGYLIFNLIFAVLFCRYFMRINSVRDKEDESRD